MRGNTSFDELAAYPSNIRMLQADVCRAGSAWTSDAGALSGGHGLPAWQSSYEPNAAPASSTCASAAARH